MKNETTMPLTGDALISKVDEMRDANLSTSEITLACGYIKDDGKPAFIPFYDAMMQAKWPNGLPHEDTEFEEGSKAAELAESYPVSAIEAFCEYWSADDLEFFEDAYEGEFESGAEFAKDLVEGQYDHALDNLPLWVEFDWEETWQNLRHDYIELDDGYIFSLNW